jgi:hypothetical protein
MSTIINATTTNGVVIQPDNSGSLVLQTNSGTTALTISTAQNATFAGTVAVPTGTLYPLVSGTAVSASGTSVDFTSIPSWVKRITVMFSGVSTNGTSAIQIQIGTSGGIQSTGYNAIAFAVTTAVAANATNTTTGFGVINSANAGSSFHGSLILTSIGDASSTWSVIGNFGDSVATVRGMVIAGSKSLSGTLDRVRITTVNGTDTFDAGSINILYE